MAESLTIGQNDKKKEMDSKKQCNITWKNLTYTIQCRDPNDTSKNPQKITKYIIDSIYGYAKSGECLAIIGSSGAGKTSQLNVLSGRINFENNDREIIGDINYNGKKISNDEVCNLVGFVMQNDIFIEFMTPYETLKFGVDLRYEKTEEERQEIVDKIIKDMKLETAKDTNIGGNLLKGISGD